MNSILLAGIIASVIGFLFALVQIGLLLSEEDGNDKMKGIASAIKEGAYAFLKREYTTIGIVGFVIAILIAFALGIDYSIGFIAGLISSAFAGYVGMSISVKANLKTANKAKDGLSAALDVAYRGGTVTGIVIVSLALLGITIFYVWLRNPVEMVGYIFGASLMSLFARVGGGIYTKGADVGADIVGKVEKGIPEDDPRNPAVIADNVGDNVGDCAGMGADLFETYVVTAISAMLIGYLATNVYNLYGQKGVILPIGIGAIAIISTIIGTFFVRLGKSNYVMGALYKGVIVTAIASTIGFYILVYYTVGNMMIFADTLVGIVTMAAMVIFTEIYTSSSFKPVDDIAKSSKTGAGTNVISGLSYGLEASFLPMIVIVIAIFISFFLTGYNTNGVNIQFGLYGVAIASASMLSLTGIIISVDAFGPITDNAGGIAEMSGLPESTRMVTDELDAVGNTTKAVTKGYAIASAALASLSLFAAFKFEIGNVNLSIDNPVVLIGLFIGASLPFFFTSFLMRAVGNAASEIVEEVRRQFREIKGIMTGENKPEYGKCVDIVTKRALKELVIPGLIAVLSPLIVGFMLGPEGLAGLLLGVIIGGFPLAILMTVSGASWDNGKKYVEKGAYGGKGSDTHKAAVVGDVVGDAFKDTAGPAINPLVKVVNTISILFITIIMAHYLIHLL
ncbi:MAG: sodium-translocating pyrophosphatase [Thermoplasmata archaeon]